MEVFQEYPPQQRKLALSYGVEGNILAELAASEDVTDKQFIEIIRKAYCLVYPERVVKDNLPKVVKVVSQRIVELQKQSTEETKVTTKPAKSFGTNYSEWLSGLTPTDVCLYLASNDLDKALKLYWTVDIKVIQVMLQAKGLEDNQTMLAQMEACMYGFGGKYSDDEGSSEKAVEINSPEGKATLQSFGF